MTGWKSAFQDAARSDRIRPAGFSGPVKNLTRDDVDLAKFARLRAERDSLQAAILDAIEQHRNVRSERQKLEAIAEENRQRGQMTSYRRVTTGISPSGVRTEELIPVSSSGALAPGNARTLEKLCEKEKALARHRDALKKKAEPLQRLVANLETFLRECKIDPDDILPPPPRPAVTPAPGKVPSPNDVEKVHSQIETEKRDHKKIKKTYVSEEDAFRDIDKWIAEAAARLDRVDTRGLHGGSFSFFSQGHVVPEFYRDAEGNVRAESNLNPGSGENFAMMEAFAAKFEPEKLRKFLRERARAQAERAGGFGPKNRDELLRAKEEKILRLERKAEDLITAIETAGGSYPRRGDARPDIVLALSPELEAA